MENLAKALVGVNLLRWIVTYPVDKVIRSLNTWGQIVKGMGSNHVGNSDLSLSHIYAHIFKAKWRLLRLLSFKYFSQHVATSLSI